MNKKHLIMVLAALLIVPVIVPSVCAQNETVTSESIFDGLRIIYFNTVTKITINNKTLPNNPIEPGKSFKGIKATVQFNYEIPSLFPKLLINTKIGRWILFRDKNYNMSVNINLSVSKIPEWCEVTIPNPVVTIEDISTEFMNATFNFNIAVNKAAEAFQEGDIQIKATFTPDKAWGLKQSEASDSFKVKSGYAGELNASFTLSDNLNKLVFEEGETKTIPLFIRNDYNSEVIIYLEPYYQFINDSDFIVTFNQKNVTLAPWKNTTVNVNITTTARDSFFGSESIFGSDLIKLTPRFTKNPTINLSNIGVGDIDLEVKIKGHVMDTLLIVFAIIAILIIVIVIIFVLRKRKR